MQNKKVVILGAGGTIAGMASNTSGNALSNVQYTAGEVGVADLLEAIPVLRQSNLIETEQVAQVDSKDMSFTVWTALATRGSAPFGARRCGRGCDHPRNRHA